MPSFGQSNPTDSQTLQSILTEIRQLRHDLQTATVASQKAQILVHRLDMEQSVVRLMQERVDNAQNALEHIRLDRQTRANRIKQFEDQESSSDSGSPQQKQIDDVLTQMKGMYETLASQEQEAQAKLTDAQEQLRLEQGKMSSLEDQLDQLEQSLENLGHKPQ
jgi:chromosome segregation ATPase